MPNLAQRAAIGALAASVVVGGGTGTGLPGYALVYKTAIQNITTTGAAMTFGAEVEDLINAYTSGSPTRMTVDSSYNSRYVRLSGGLMVSDDVTDAYVIKAGVSFIGSPKQTGSSTGATGVTVFSAPVLVTTADYFELFAIKLSGGNDDTSTNEYNFFEMEALPSTFNGALVYKSSGQAIAASTTVAMVWDSETYDLGGWHDPVTNNERLTVPSGISLVRVVANLQGAANSSQLYTSLRKNGTAGLPGLFLKDVEDTVGAARAINAVSAPLAVTPGDYFDVTAFSGSAETIASGNFSWASIEALNPALKYALASRSTNQAMTSNAYTAIQFTTEDVDTNSWFTTGANTRMTVPSGVSRVRLVGAISLASSSDQSIVEFRKNGSIFVGGGQYENATAGGEELNIASAIVPVTAGDYFEMFHFSGTGRTCSAAWFSIEEALT